MAGLQSHATNEEMHVVTSHMRPYTNIKSAAYVALKRHLTRQIWVYVAASSEDAFAFVSLLGIGLLPWHRQAAARINNKEMRSAQDCPLAL